MSEKTVAKVIIVDESLFVRKMIKTILNCDHNYEVIAECRTGNEGVLVARKLQPEIIVLGGQLNDLSCEQFREKLNLYDNKFRVIVITENEKCKSCVLGFESGRCEMIQQPFNPESLLDILKNTSGKELVKIAK